MGILDKPFYKDYRNLKFEKFINGLGIILTCTLLVAVTYAIRHHFGGFYALGFMFLYFIVQRMRKQTIYYYSDRDLGPGWKSILCRDIAHAIRDTCACLGSSWLIDVFVG